MTFFVSRTFRAELTIFVDRNTRYNAELLAPVLARYYDITDSWSGIDEIFQDPPWLVSRDMRRPVPYRTQLFWPEDRRLLIANAEANIVFDSKSELAGSLMTASVLESAIPISLTANAQPSGYVLIGSTHEPMLIERFQADFRRGVIIVALMISSIAILIGFLISRQLTAPIRRLTRATANTSVGNWPYTTTTSPGRDEVGQLEQAFSDMTVRLHHAQEQRLGLPVHTRSTVLQNQYLEQPGQEYRGPHVVHHPAHAGDKTQRVKGPPDELAIHHIQKKCKP